jgi:serine phosphatase RsbU (regulator of sigma subunit)
MDIALCVLDFEKRKLEYAGAYNPVYLVRNGELITYKGDKVPIGAFIDEELHEYTNNSIDLLSGDMIFISSDGYEDQFGGEQNKKFMVSKFRNLLLSIAPEPIERQKELLNQAFLDWKGENEQVDDILVIGVRIS